MARLDAPARGRGHLQRRVSGPRRHQSIVDRRARGVVVRIVFRDHLQPDAEDQQNRNRYWINRHINAVKKLFEWSAARDFVDKSVVEVFANSRQAIARRIYPERADSIGVSLFSTGGTTRVPTLEAWKIMPSNPY